MSMQYAFKVKISEHIMEDNIGQLICTDVILARDGIYEYSSDEIFRDGKFNIVELHREWEDVKKLKYTLEGKPVVYFHPDRDTDIDLNNLSELTVGHLQNVREAKAEGYNVLIGDLFLKDKKVIEQVKEGRLREISLGYFYEINDENKSHLKQVDMVAEHIALVDQGRAGIAKIIDSTDANYVLAKLYKKGEAKYVVHTMDEPENLRVWRKVNSYGYVKEAVIDFDQASRLSLQMIGLIIKMTPVGVFVVLDKDKNVVKAYKYGQKTDILDLYSEGYDLDTFEISEELDPYDIPDEQRQKLESLTNNYYVNDLIVMADSLRLLLDKVKSIINIKKDFSENIYWQKMVSFMIFNEELIEEVLNKRLPRNRNDYEWYAIAQEVLNKAYNLKTKAQDELMVTLLVAAFDKEKVDMDIVISIEEAIKFFKEHGQKVKTMDSLEEFITEANEIQGVYVIKFDDFDKEIALARTFTDDSVEICVCADIEELNKKINENFNSVEDAANTINTKEGRFSTMSVLLLK
jgi:hypothetical protein